MVYHTFKDNGGTRHFTGELPSCGAVEASEPIEHSNLVNVLLYAQLPNAGDTPFCHVCATNMAVTLQPDSAEHRVVNSTQSDPTLLGIPFWVNGPRTAAGTTAVPADARMIYRTRLAQQDGELNLTVSVAMKIGGLGGTRSKAWAWVGLGPRGNRLILEGYNLAAVLEAARAYVLCYNESMPDVGSAGRPSRTTLYLALAPKPEPEPSCCKCGTTEHGGRAFYVNHVGLRFCWPCADGKRSEPEASQDAEQLRVEILAEIGRGYSAWGMARDGMEAESAALQTLSNIRDMLKARPSQP